MSKRAILLVPGFSKKEQLEARDKLVDAIDSYSDGYISSISDGLADNGGYNSRQINISSRQNPDEALTLDVFEAYWGDLVPDFSDENPSKRLMRATKLLGYWFFGGLTKGFLRRKAPTKVGTLLAASGVLLVAWYLIVLISFLEAFSSGVEDSTMLTNLLTYLGLTAETAEPMANYIKTSSFIVFLLGIFGVGRLENIANIADFSKSYLTDQVFGEDSSGVRAKTRKRVITALDHITNSDVGYTEIHVVAHSFGGAIAVDALAEFGQSLEKITLHTWGTPLWSFSQQEPLIKAELKKLYEAKTPLADWVDVVIPTDWAGTRIPHREEYEQFKGKPTLEPNGPQGQLFMNTRIIHESYYRNETAILQLLKAT